MRAGFWLGLMAGGLVFLAGFLGGASLPGAGQRAIMAFVFFGLSGWVLQTLWRALLSPGARPGRAVPARPGDAAARPESAQAQMPGGPAPSPSPERAGARLDQVLPPVSPAELFEPLSPPVLTKDAMEE